MHELRHSAKGSTWKKHKYTAIKNGRYIYSDDNYPYEPGKNWITPGSKENWDIKDSKDGRHRYVTYKFNEYIGSPARSEDLERHFPNGDYYDENVGRIVRDREHNRLRIMSKAHYTENGVEQRSINTMGSYEKQARDAGRKAVRDDKNNKKLAARDKRTAGEKYYETLQKKKARVSTNNYKKTNVQYKTEKAKMAVSSAIKKVSKATKSSVSKGRSVVSSALSKLRSLLKKRG